LDPVGVAAARIGHGLWSGYEKLRILERADRQRKVSEARGASDLLFARFLHQLDDAPGFGLRYRPALLDHDQITGVEFALSSWA
jgi:hypothetical protein